MILPLNKIVLVNILGLLHIQCLGYIIFLKPTLGHLQVNSVTISHLKPCVTYQITVTPKVADTVNGLSMKVEATVVAEGKFAKI